MPAGSRRGARREALTGEESVTAAIYEAGYSAPSRFYDTANARLGMTPSVWKRGGAGVTIRWTVAETSLGPLLIAATDKGLCRVAFDEDWTTSPRAFPPPRSSRAAPRWPTSPRAWSARSRTPGRHTDLPIDVQGTAFQEAVWNALRAIPAGETRSYAQLAAAAGSAGAVRAVGTACGANAVAVVIPCHRVTRTDGTIGGYAYGVDRKARCSSARALMAIASAASTPRRSCRFTACPTPTWLRAAWCG